MQLDTGKKRIEGKDMGLGDWILTKTIKNTIASMDFATGGDNHNMERALFWASTRSSEVDIMAHLRWIERFPQHSISKEGATAADIVKADLEKGLVPEHNETKAEKVRALIDQEIRKGML
ncbi:hypothetical protein [Kordiimonas pumila]|uniref:Uncharacterized protein n=1 Tax=Kordiimonas pumila TaxID=2161677 RepID=A0ABV7D1F9_9PROT|nr:hypothetical protein [Kordiimonas pumila]